MSNGYIGAFRKFASFPPEKISAGSTSKLLQYAPGSAEALLVFVGAVPQEPNVSYTVSGNVITFAEAVPYDGWIMYRGVEDSTSSSMNNDPTLAERWISSIGQIDEWIGYVPMDGGTYLRDQYPDAWNLIKLGKVPVVSESAWITDPSKRGSFTVGNGETTFRVPDRNGKTEGNPPLSSSGVYIVKLYGAVVNSGLMDASKLDRAVQRKVDKSSILGPCGPLIGGIPSGAIIESGSNANGRYTKYADGTLIAVKGISYTQPCNIAFGSLFETASIELGDSPHPMLSGTVTLFNITGNSVGVAVQNTAPTTTSFGTCKIWRPTSLPSQTGQVYMSYIGRWF